ncbi:MAG: hypothetical protein QNK89_04380 [Lacinutrix sp.]|uniref:hypothetical protein n=1 Tax=Lacinutrix sp. TaxID=1937692 RepID=UPI0030B6423F
MSIRIVNLSTYTTPEVKEYKNKNWVAYGEDNNYYQFLIDRYNGSATNNAAINGISQMIFGRGIDATNSNKRPDEYAQMKSLLKDDDVRKLSYDLKLMGQCAMQVVYNKKHTRIIEVAHFPIETLRSGKANEEGEVDSYYYMADWSEVKPSDEPERLAAFGTSKENIEIYCVKPYRAGFYYYSPVDYQGGLQYAELEEEIANYHLNNIMNGLAPSMLINFNNGIPDEEERSIIENKIREKFSGSSNAGRFILSFNDNNESGATVEPVQLSDAHQQYQFLSEESMSKVMVSHRIISPMLLGIKDNTGLGNNAEELKTASVLMDNTVIRPFQNLLIGAFDNILAFNGITLNLYFRTLQPLEFIDLENAMTKEQVEEETGEKLSTQLKAPCWDGYEQIGTKINDGKEVPNCVPLEDIDRLKSDIYNSLMNIEDEDLSEYELIDTRPANEYDDKLNSSIKFASAISSSPAKVSEQDTSILKVRYKYTTGRSTEGKTRDFCDKMLSADKVYRKEDLDKQSSDNSQFAPSGESSYNIWLYKGGVNCSHYWERRTYLRKNNKQISVAEARAKIMELDPSLRKEAKMPVNAPEVAQIASAKNNYWRK